MSASERGYAHKCKVTKLQSPSAPSTALVAVALQDHLTRQYSLSESPPKKRVHGVSVPPPRSGCNKCGKEPRHSNRKQPVKQMTVHINSDLLALNTNSDSRERVRPAQLVKAVKQAQTGRNEPVERVLDKAPPPLSLAQRLGLIESPPSLLSNEEWARLKSISNHRQDSTQPCPICHEPFGLSQQVLLSCSHVFHLSCLKSLERFSHCKRCPMCRRENYQKRIICEGAHYYRNWAAIVIQSAWRGFAVRNWYSSYREKFPPSHPTLRRKHFERRLEKLTDGLLKSCEERSSGAESVLAESDRALESARQAIRIFEHTLADSASLDNWCNAYSKAKEHEMSECPVCLVGLHPPVAADSTLQPRPIAILSCGHLFHFKCIESLERHCQQQVDLCPLCRTPYLKQLYNVRNNE